MLSPPNPPAQSKHAVTTQEANGGSRRLRLLFGASRTGLRIGTIHSLRWTASATVMQSSEWMMAEKARLFGDAKIRRAILATQDPQKQKS